jgi:hypothetical protein
MYGLRPLKNATHRNAPFDPQSCGVVILKGAVQCISPATWLTTSRVFLEVLAADRAVNGLT